MDFLGMNYYFRRIAQATPDNAPPALPPGAQVAESGCACADVVVDGRVDDHHVIAGDSLAQSRHQH